MTLFCECCPFVHETPDYDRYIIHLQLAHPLGELARAVEPSLFGGAVLNEAPAAKPRIWDRWDRGGRSGPATRCPGPLGA